MAEFHIDVAVANRFISSLSKSLQALCHGCMDFDSGIEIGGHIYVKIDCESKADYVLDEKVEKSTDNSMKFVSNSFLAVKDKSKPTRDGACSPVQELQIPVMQPSSYNQRAPHHQYMGNQQHINKSPYSYNSHSQGQRGGHKRGWSGTHRDWRTSPKKPFRNNQNPLPQQQPSSYSNQSASQTTASHNTSHHDPSTSSHLQHDTPVLKSTGNTSAPVNVKQEFLNSDSAQTSSLATESVDTDSVNSNLNIKSEPSTNLKSEENANAASESGDQNFLQQPNEGDHHRDNEASSHGQGESDGPPQDSANNGDSANVNKSDKNDDMLGAESSGFPLEYDMADSEAGYSQSGHGGEEEGDQSGFGEDQFDVIEIGDEDEDMQAMFGDNQHESSPCTSQPPRGQPYHQAPHTHHTPHYDPATQQLTMYHQGPTDPGPGFQFVCPICDKTLQSKSGMRHHLKAHKGKQFKCPLCDSRFTQRFNIKSHLRYIHSSAQCVVCSGTFSLGEEYNAHVLKCK